MPCKRTRIFEAIFLASVHGECLRYTEDVDVVFYEEKQFVVNFGTWTINQSASWQLRVLRLLAKWRSWKNWDKKMAKLYFWLSIYSVTALSRNRTRVATRWKAREVKGTCANHCTTNTPHIPYLSYTSTLSWLNLLVLTHWLNSVQSRSSTSHCLIGDFCSILATWNYFHHQQTRTNGPYSKQKNTAV